MESLQVKYLDRDTPRNGFRTLAVASFSFLVLELCLGLNQQRNSINRQLSMLQYPHRLSTARIIHGQKPRLFPAPKMVLSEHLAIAIAFAASDHPYCPLAMPNRGTRWSRSMELNGCKHDE